MIDRDSALALVRERIPNKNLVNHSVAVEIIMGALARHLGLSDTEIERWELAGLLHDLDYAETAEDFDRHGVITVELLGEEIDEEMAHAILAHADKAPRESVMDRALYAADPTTGFIVAAALVRPDKSLTAVEVSSLKKRWKEKAFARGANREQMAACAELGLERDEFLAIALEAMQARSTDVGL
ncbi:MAG: HD domain-containing protein [Coriobacteriia bacterium]